MIFHRNQILEVQQMNLVPLSCQSKVKEYTYQLVFKKLIWKIPVSAPILKQHQIPQTSNRKVPKKTTPCLHNIHYQLEVSWKMPLDPLIARTISQAQVTWFKLVCPSSRKPLQLWLTSHLEITLNEVNEKLLKILRLKCQNRNCWFQK